MLNKLVPTLYTEDLEATIDFYVNTLGFTCRSHRPDWGWALLQMDQVEIMLSLPNDHLLFDKPVFTGSFYCYTEQVEELWEKWKDKTTIAYPLETFDHGMKEFALYDNNGYMLQFGQEL